MERVDSKTYLERMLAAPRPGAGQVLAFYEHRVGAICKDPALMLMPWDDHLVHRGDGVFETIRFTERKVIHLDAHRIEARAALAIGGAFGRDEDHPPFNFGCGRH